jgi:hypothetical protein
MATGSDSAPGGLGVPLYGDFQIIQRTAATDMMTLTAASGGTGDFIVCENNSGTELVTISYLGAIDFQGGTMTTGNLDLSGGGQLILELEQYTTAPSTGLTTGQLILYTAGNAVYLGVATAAGTLVEVLLN